MTASWSEINWIGVFLIPLLTFWMPFSSWVTYAFYKEIREYFKKKKWYLPTAWTFGVVWFFIYAMVASGVFLFYNYEIGNFARQNVTIFFTVWAANLFFSKMWPIIFFGLKRYGWAFFVAFLVAGTATVMAVFAAIEAYNNESLIWITFGFLIPYIMWSYYATYLSFVIWRYYKDPSKKKKSNRSLLERDNK